MEFDYAPHPITWLRDRYREGNLTLRPPYQRKPVWTPKQKCYLIESILMTLPVPEIYVQESISPDGETRYAVVDGQQRVRTVLQFIGADQDPEEAESNNFVLDRLPADSPWRNLPFQALGDDARKRFYGYKFAFRFLKTESDDAVRDMFRRLNKYLSPLKPQELRNATYQGPFSALALRLSDADYWVESKIVTAAAIRRMNDIEFVSELIIGVMHGPQAGSSKVIDDYYFQYEDYEDEFPNQKETEHIFETTLNVVRLIFPTIKETRWANKTDFYSLFVAVAQLVRDGEKFSNARSSRLRDRLLTFAGAVAKRLADEQAVVTKQAIEYVRAVEKGANDKARRASRHQVLLKLLRSTT